MAADKPRRGSIADSARLAAELHAGGSRALKAALELIPSDSQLQVRCSTARLERYRAAAKRAKAKNLSAWVLAALDDASEK